MNLPEMYEEHLPKARKSHTCHECGGAVNAGERYLRMSQVFEGEFWSAAVCRRCQWLRFQIAGLERKEGCHNHEAWPLIGNLAESVMQYDIVGPDQHWKELQPPDEFVVSPQTSQWVSTVPNPRKCDSCGAPQGEENGWFRVMISDYDHGDRPGAWILPSPPFYALGKEGKEKDACGVTCALKLASKMLTGAE